MLWKAVCRWTLSRWTSRKLWKLTEAGVKKAVADLKVSEQIASRVSAEIDSRQAEFASLLYRTYKESLVEELTKEIIERTKQAEQEEIAKSVSESEKQTAEYEAFNDKTFFFGNPNGYAHTFGDFKDAYFDLT